MNRIFALSALLSVLALSTSSLAPNSRYGAPHSRNSLNYRGDSRYPSHPAAPSAPLAPRAPVAPAYGGNQGRSHGYGGPALHQSPRLPQAPRVPQQPRVPQSSVHQGAQGLFGGAGRHFNPAGPSLNHYSAPSAYGGAVPYSGHAARGISQRSVYESQQPAFNNNGARNNHSPHQNYGQTQQQAQSTSHAHGREMRYEVRDPQNRGTTHVTETHIVSNKQMHGAEAEAAMKKLMGSMGTGSDGGFDNFFKGVGLPFY